MTMKEKKKREPKRNKLLKVLLQIGRIRKQDLMRYARTLYSAKAKPSEEYKRLLKDGYIKETIYKNPKSPTGEDIAIVITKEGKKYLTDTDIKYKALSNEDSFQKTHLQKEGVKLSSEMERTLTDNGIKLMFLMSGVPFAKSVKPSLEHLYNIYRFDNEINLKGYADKNMSKDLCEKIMSRSGVYYSIAEVYAFFNSINVYGFHDSAYGSRARGIYISKHSCYVVYTSWRYKNKLVKIYQHGEENLLSMLGKVLPYFTRACSPIKLIDKNYYPHKPGAIIFSDGEPLMVSTATGCAEGKLSTKHDAANLNKLALEKSTSGVRSSLILTYDSNYYRDIYVIPQSKAGAIQLRYLTHNSMDDIIQDGRSVIEKTDLFVTDKNLIQKAMYPYKAKEGDGTPVYLPLFDVKMIHWLREKKDKEPIVFTRIELANSISHSVAKPIKFYDIKTGQRISDENYLYYAENGEALGTYMIKEYLAKENLGIDNKKGQSVIINIAKDFNLTPTAFLNEVAKRTIPIELIRKNLPTKELHAEAKSVQSKKRGKDFHILLSPKAYEILENEKEKNNISYSTLIENAIYSVYAEK